MRAELEIDVGIRVDNRDEVVGEAERCPRCGFQRRHGLARLLPEAGTLLANVEYRGCGAPVLAADGSARGVMTLLFTVTYQQSEPTPMRRGEGSR